MKVDLHLHSVVSAKNGHRISWPDSYYEVIKKLKQHNVKIASFSDHNLFDYKFYKEISLLAQKAQILILPAIELNVVRKNGLVANMIYVFSNKLLETQYYEIEQITQKLHRSGIKLSVVNAIFKKYEPILIAHVGKSDYFTFEDLKDIDYHAIELSSKKHRNYIKFKDKANNNFSQVAFSDTHFWEKYPELSNLYTDINLQTASFKNLKEALLKNKCYIKGEND